LLLDTHVLIWAMAEPARLDERARMAIVSPEHHILVSAAAVWEIAIKRALGRLKFPLERLTETMERMGFEPLPIHLRHAIAAGGLPRFHDDPFDRMLVAQAQLEKLVLVSEDATIARYDVSILGGAGS
jgi:PIN domain nuclease of toxin-antitoxin system